MALLVWIFSFDIRKSGVKYLSLDDANNDDGILNYNLHSKTGTA